MSTAGVTSPWLIRRTHVPTPASHLYCLPHAGGSPGEYVRWSDGLAGIQVWAIRAPGQPGRTDEPPCTRMTALVGGIVNAVRFARPYALFGHSLGALVAFEVARLAQRRWGAGPDHLFVSACPPPPDVRSPLGDLPDDELLAEVQRRWGLLPAEVIAVPALREQAIRRFRADLTVLETYRMSDATPVDCPITALGGVDDPESASLPRWFVYTRAPFTVRMFPGGHFYFRDEWSDLLRIIDDTLKGRALTDETESRS